MVIITEQANHITSLLVLQARGFESQTFTKWASGSSSNKLGYGSSVKQAWNSECIIVSNHLRQSERRWRSVPLYLVYKVTWLLKSGCFEGTQCSAVVSWVPSPSERIPHSPPSHSQSGGCTSLWCFAGNWPEEIWGRILTWVLIIRWVIVFVLLSTYTRDASGLLWDGEIHLAKKNISTVLFMAYSLSDGRCFSVSYFTCFWAGTILQSCLLAQHVPPRRITLPKSMRELGFATWHFLSLSGLHISFPKHEVKNHFPPVVDYHAGLYGTVRNARALGQRKICFLLLGICFEIEMLIPMSASKC